MSAVFALIASSLACLTIAVICFLLRYPLRFLHTLVVCIVGDKIIITTRYHYLIEKFIRRNIVSSSKGRKLVRVRRAPWLSRSEVRQRWNLWHRDKQAFLTIRSLDELNKFVLGEPAVTVLQDLYVPYTSDRFTQADMDTYGAEAENPQHWIRYYNGESLMEFAHGFMWVTLAMSAILFMVSGLAYLDEVPKNVQITISVPGRDKFVIKDTTVEDSRNRIMVDGDFANYVFAGKVFKSEEIGGGLSQVCLGEQISQACGKGIGKFEIGQMIYLRASESAYQGDMSGYSRQTEKHVISKEEADPLIKSGRLTLIKR